MIALLLNVLDLILKVLLTGSNLLEEAILDLSIEIH
jgi:hypothetical protein